MKNSEGLVLVGIDQSAGSDIALAWAVEAARARRAPLKILCAYRWLIDYGPMFDADEMPPTDRAGARVVAEDVIAGALAQVAELDPRRGLRRSCGR